MDPSIPETTEASTPAPPIGFSFLRLREVIDAKIARRIQLLAEVAFIERELAEAQAFLAGMKSLSLTTVAAATTAPVAAPVEAPTLAMVKVVPPGMIKCYRCAKHKQSHEGRGICAECYAVTKREGIRICRACGKEFMGVKTRTMCRECRRKVLMNNANRARGFTKEELKLLEKVDQRIEVGPIKYEGVG